MLTIFIVTFNHSITTDSYCYNNGYNNGYNNSYNNGYNNTHNKTYNH